MIRRRSSYIETLARRGYRWMVSVDYVDLPSPASDACREKEVQETYSQEGFPLPRVGDIGRWRNGVVYKAEMSSWAAWFGLKFLPEELASDPMTLERFAARSARALALNHPNICTIYGTDEHEGHPFIVMELLEGKSLTELISGSGGNQRPLPRLEEFLDIAIQVSEGLEAAHAMGIVHRDIKPGNIFVTVAARPKSSISDWPRKRPGRASRARPIRRRSAGNRPTINESWRSHRHDRLHVAGAGTG